MKGAKVGNKITLSPGRLLSVFERQAGYLVDKKYDQLAGVSKEIFLKELDKLSKELKNFKYLRFEKGHIPMLIVISRHILDIDLQMKKLKIGGYPGYSDIENYDRFQAPAVQKMIYLIFNVDAGRDLDYCGAKTAKAALLANGRAGLLIEEGIALARYYKHTVMAKSFYLTGSPQDVMSVVPTLIYRPKSACVKLTLTKGAPHQYVQVPSRDAMFD